MMPLIFRQFCAHGELHKERFDKLIGLINSKRCQPDEFAFARCVPERVLSRISAICSDMNRHVRLENRRIASTCEIVDDPLKEAVCRLGRDKPVSNDGLPGHETTTGSGSTPLLQLDNVTFGISRINHDESVRRLLLPPWQFLPLRHRRLRSLLVALHPRCPPRMQCGRIRTR